MWRVVRVSRGAEGAGAGRCGLSSGSEGAWGWGWRFPSDLREGCARESPAWRDGLAMGD